MAAHMGSSGPLVSPLVAAPPGHVSDSTSTSGGAASHSGHRQPNGSSGDAPSGVNNSMQGQHSQSGVMRRSSDGLASNSNSGAHGAACLTGGQHGPMPGQQLLPPAEHMGGMLTMAPAAAGLAQHLQHTGSEHAVGEGPWQDARAGSSAMQDGGSHGDSAAGQLLILGTKRPPDSYPAGEVGASDAKRSHALGPGGLEEVGAGADLLQHLQMGGQALGGAIDPRAVMGGRSLHVSPAFEAVRSGPGVCSVECGTAHGLFDLSTERITCHCPDCEQAAASGYPNEFIPSEFERHGGMAACKKWRFSIKVTDHQPTLTLGRWLDMRGVTITSYPTKVQRPGRRPAAVPTRHHGQAGRRQPVQAARAQSLPMHHHSSSGGGGSCDPGIAQQPSSGPLSIGTADAQVASVGGTPGGLQLAAQLIGLLANNGGLGALTGLLAGATTQANAPAPAPPSSLNPLQQLMSAGLSLNPSLALQQAQVAAQPHMQQFAPAGLQPVQLQHHLHQFQQPQQLPPQPTFGLPTPLGPAAAGMAGDLAGGVDEPALGAFGSDAAAAAAAAALAADGDDQVPPGYLAAATAAAGTGADTGVPPVSAAGGLAPTLSNASLSTSFSLSKPLGSGLLSADGLILQQLLHPTASVPPLPTVGSGMNGANGHAMGKDAGSLLQQLLTQRSAGVSGLGGPLGSGSALLPSANSGSLLLTQPRSPGGTQHMHGADAASAIEQARALIHGKPGQGQPLMVQPASTMPLAPTASLAAAACAALGRGRQETGEREAGAVGALQGLATASAASLGPVVADTVAAKDATMSGPAGQAPDVAPHAGGVAAGPKVTGAMLPPTCGLSKTDDLLNKLMELKQDRKRKMQLEEENAALKTQAAAQEAELAGLAAEVAALRADQARQAAEAEQLRSDLAAEREQCRHVQSQLQLVLNKLGDMD